MLSRMSASFATHYLPLIVLWEIKHKMHSRVNLACVGTTSQALPPSTDLIVWLFSHVFNLRFPNPIMTESPP